MATHGRVGERHVDQNNFSGFVRAVEGKKGQLMPQTLRKMVGAVALVALVVIYALVATTIAVAKLSDAPAWAHLLYFFVTGILWVLPAMAVVSWMLKPDRK